MELPGAVTTHIEAKYTTILTIDSLSISGYIARKNKNGAIATTFGTVVKTIHNTKIQGIK